MAKCVHPNTVVKTKAFLYLPSMSFINMKLAPYSILHSISIQLIKLINEMPSFAQIFKWVSHQLSQTKHEVTRNSVLIL